MTQWCWEFIVWLWGFSWYIAMSGIYRSHAYSGELRSRVWCREFSFQNIEICIVFSSVMMLGMYHTIHIIVVIFSQMLQCTFVRHCPRPVALTAATIHWSNCMMLSNHTILYYCNMVEWSWWDSSLIWKTNWFPSVLWHCWFGHITCKNRPRYDL